MSFFNFCHDINHVLYDMYEMQEKEKDSRDGKLKEKKLTSIKEKVMNQKGSWIGTNVEWTE